MKDQPDDSVMRLFAIANERVVWHCRPHTQEVTALAFSPDGKTLVTAGQ